MKMRLMLGTLTAALLITGCSQADATVEKAVEPVKQVAASAVAVAAPTITEESLGLRKTDLYSENTTTGDETKYATTAAGSGVTIERAFDNAPPMIPHDVEGMLPITTNNNSCVGCHAPEVAPSMNATPMPKSHFTDFRPATAIAADGKITKEGKGVDNTSDFLTVATSLDHMNKARFNCSQCHAPQSTGDLIVENTFRPDFQSEKMKKGSSMLETLNAGVE